MANQKKPQKFTDASVQALRDFEFKGLFLDSVVRGLRLRLGVHRCTWQFFREFRDHGKRGSICKRLGFFPEMDVETARNEALQIAARFASGRREPGRGQATKFSDAYSAYVEYLRRQSERRGKQPTWARNVEKLGRLYLLPEFGKWSLAEMSASPAVIADWHRKLSERAPFSANRSAELIRVIYRRAARLDRSLPPHNPSSAVEYNSEKPSQAGLAVKDFPAWGIAWRSISSPVHRGYALAMLLTGARGSELSGLRWRDIDCKRRTMTFVNSKSGSDVTIPLSVEIVKALKLARSGLPPAVGPGKLARVGQRSVDQLVFPGCKQARDGLPARGHELRRTWRSIAFDLGIDELQSAALLGHSVPGISSRYILKLAAASGRGMRESQARVSRRIVELLGVAI